MARTTVNHVGSPATADTAIRNPAYPDRTLCMTGAGLGNDTNGVDALFTQLKNNAITTGPWDAYYGVYNHRAADNLTTIAFDLSSGTDTPAPAFYFYKSCTSLPRPA